MCSAGSGTGSSPARAGSSPASSRARRYAITSFFVTRPRRPVPSIRVSTVPTSTVSPASTITSASRPLTGAGTSLSALSVEISSRGSSAWTVSPGCFFHSRTVASAIDTPIWGIVTSIEPFLVREELTASLPHVLDLRQHGTLERRAERDRHVRRGHAHHRAVEILEGLLRDQRGDLGRHATGAGGLLDEHHLARLAHAGEHRVAVVGVERAQVEHLDPGAVEVLGRLERGEHHRSIRDHGEVLARARQARLAEGGLVAPLPDLALGAPVEMLVLHEEHRIGVADRGGDQPLGVLGRG